MTEFELKWQEVQNYILAAFDKQAPETITNFQIRGEQAFAMPIRDFFQKYTDNQSPSWTDVISFCHSKANRIRQSEPSFFEMHDSFHLLIEPKRVRLISASFFKFPAHPALHLMGIEQDIIPLSYEPEMSHWPLTIVYGHDNPSLEVCNLYAHCFCAGKSKNKEKEGTIIDQMFYTDGLHRGKNNSFIKYHVRTPALISDLMKSLPKEQQWKIIEEEQETFYDETTLSKESIKPPDHVRQPIIMSNPQPRIRS